MKNHGREERGAGVDVKNQRGRENLPLLVPPIGHPQRAAALEFLRLPLTASDEDVRLRVAELMRVNDENVGLNAQGLPLTSDETWEPDPAWHEYRARFIEGELDGPWPIMRIHVRNEWAGRDRARAMLIGSDIVGLEVSPERHQRIIEWRRHPAYAEIPYEALFKGGDPEEPDSPIGQDIDDRPWSTMPVCNSK